MTRAALNAVAFALALAAAGSAGAAVVTRGPYLQRTSDRATVLRWRTDVATDSVARYGAAPAALNFSVTQPAATTEHEVELAGLAADTTYFYSVGSTSAVLAGGDGEHAFRTHPPRGAAREEGIVFWITGDQGSGYSIATQVRDRALAISAQLGWPIDAWLALGDNAYGQGSFAEGTDGAYQGGLFAPFASVMRKAAAWPCLGNHDVTGPVGLTNHEAFFTLPAAGQLGGVPSGTERWFSFDIGNVHVVNLQWENIYVEDAMALWLVADLAANQRPWTIVYLHAPFHAFGAPGGHDTDLENILVDYREVLTPIFAAHGVDLVLSGHEHSYQRSALVASGFAGYSTEFNPAVHELDSTSPYEKLSGNGVVYAVVGNSGKGGAAHPVHPVARFAREGNGSALLRVTCDRMEFRYVDRSAGITDSFDLVKPAACAPPPCAAGNVPAPGGGGALYPMLRVNGSSGDRFGTVSVPAGAPMTVSMVYSTPGPADVLEVFGRAGAAAPGDAFVAAGWGEFCFAPKPLQPGNPRLFTLGVGQSDPPPVSIPWSRSYLVPASLAGRTIELQGAIGRGAMRFVTNRVRIEIE